MQVILTTNIKKLGNLGEVVKVQAGYALNFLLPQGKAMEATTENQAYFETVRHEYETRLVELNQDMEAKAKKIESIAMAIAVNASDEGQLYGAITAKTVVDFYANHSIPLSPTEIILPADKIKQIGEYKIGFGLGLDREVTQTITVTAK